MCNISKRLDVNSFRIVRTCNGISRMIDSVNEEDFSEGGLLNGLRLEQCAPSILLHDAVDRNALNALPRFAIHHSLFLPLVVLPLLPTASSKRVHQQSVQLLHEQHTRRMSDPNTTVKNPQTLRSLSRVLKKNQIRFVGKQNKLSPS